jgi:DNA-binding LytR/AlgR family response regulator
MPPTAIIADDEAPLRAFLRRRLAESWPELDIVDEAANGQEALDLIARHQPDIAFLDIQMPVLGGLDVAARLPAEVRTVFVTAYDQYALEAFDRAAVDYLLKPVNRERLQKTVERLKAPRSQREWDAAALASELADRLRPQRAHLQWLQASTSAGIVMIAVTDVIYFQAQDKYTLVATAGGEHLIRMSLKELEAALDPDRFWRVHRNAIVSVAAIENVAHDSRGNYVIRLRGNAQRIAVGRNYASRFKPL